MKKMPDNLFPEEYENEEEYFEDEEYEGTEEEIQKKRKMQVINPASFLILILETLLRFTMEN